MYYLDADWSVDSRISYCQNVLPRRGLVNVEFAFKEVASKFLNELGKIDNEYLRERAAYMRDVTF
jgi:phosphoenolpyruvate-protein kinase (PTS system EI component)